MNNSINIIPKPQKAIRKDGVFVLPAGHTISWPGECQQAALLGQKLTVAVKVSGKGQIRLIIDSAISGPETNQLVIR